MRKSLTEQAKQIELIIRGKVVGEPPQDFAGAVRVAAVFNLDCDPHQGESGYVAHLIEWSPGQWSIRYNPNQSEYRLVMGIYHEIAEYLQRVIDPGFWDDELDVRCDGAGNSDHERHIIAEIVARRLAGIVKREAPRLQPFDWKRYSRPRQEIEYVPAATFDTQEWPTVGHATE